MFNISDDERERIQAHDDAARAADDDHGQNDPPQEAMDRMARLHGPHERPAKPAHVARFKQRLRVKRARRVNRARVAVRRIAARRAPRQRRVRRVSSVARARAPTSSDGPPPRPAGHANLAGGEPAGAAR